MAQKQAQLITVYSSREGAVCAVYQANGRFTPQFYTKTGILLLMKLSYFLILFSFLLCTLICSSCSLCSLSSQKLHTKLSNLFSILPLYVLLARYPRCGYLHQSCPYALELSSLLSPFYMH